ncbi:hypothetical protein SDIAM26S_02950 [Streptomyces diastaticus subsp. diastaticus]
MARSTRPPAPNRAAGLLVLCSAVAAAGGLAAGDADRVHAFLHRPAWPPPAWLFGPVRTVLYATIAVAGARRPHHVAAP